ncbi:XRE family transcriptional regulator [Rhodoferax sp.]|uniref:LexA family protein n=1 Tax=Rhodoferax sp. TaxID=50421 RepID=UPI002ACE6E43|nr:XRE family transcriptional regulator [Rhodoferax sp.]MDZ7918495.1 XRE family transcriptional regulator [Rhodoferax sp.]
MRKEFGQVIKALRTRKGLAQQDLADALEVDKGNISKYESGKQGMTFDRLEVLAHTLDTPLSELFSMAETGNIETAPEIKGTVPLISWVQAGHWNDVIDNLHPGEGERIHTTYRVRKHTYALRVRGDSMEPKFPEGAILIVEPDESPEPGAFVIVRHNGGEATFKQLVVEGNAMYLKPLNPRYPIMEVKPDAVFCGVVKRVEMDV